VFPLSLSHLSSTREQRIKRDTRNLGNNERTKPVKEHRKRSVLRKVHVSGQAKMDQPRYQPLDGRQMRLADERSKIERLRQSANQRLRSAGVHGDLMPYTSSGLRTGLTSSPRPSAGCERNGHHRQDMVGFPNPLAKAAHAAGGDRVGNRISREGTGFVVPCKKVTRRSTARRHRFSTMHRCHTPDAGHRR